MIEIVAYNTSDDQLSKVEVDEALFGEKVKKRLLKEAVLMYEANQRQGTHSTLTRAEVSLTGRKPYRQKGTGSARAGDFKSPLWKGGGVIFGPKPRDYSYSMPKKARRVAVQTAVLAKLLDNEVYFLSAFSVDAPQTKTAQAALKKMGLEGTTLVLLPSHEMMMYKSFRNIARVTVIPVEDVNAFHLLRNKNVVFLGDAFDRMKERFGHG